MSRPLIGVSKPERGAIPEYLSMAFAVWLGGGWPVALTSRHEPRGHLIDGLLLTGGLDVHPELFEQHPKADYRYDRMRDDFEMFWLRHAEARALPVLAICRGMQVMNIHRGGSLHLNVRDAYADADYPNDWLAYMLYRKTARLAADSILCRIVAATELPVNSLHTQSLDRIGDGLRVTAEETNGVVQAIEDPEQDFYLGVQFHPELLVYRAVHRRIFSGLVAAAAHRRDQRAEAHRARA